jgi:mannose-6-phosphate isomerase-like protein (cupin superfamily)
MSEAVNLQEELASFSELWSPRIVATLNDYDVMVVRVRDEFVWHSHPETDDFFLVISGELDIELRGRTVKLRPGEMFVVPRGEEHRPVARNGEAQVLLIEPRGTPNTGNPQTAVRKVRI